MNSVKRFLSGVLLVVTLALPASAAIRIGVVDFKNGVSNLPDQIVDGINSMFVTELSRSPAFQVYEREQLAAIAREHRLVQSALASDDGLVKVGRLAGLQAIITGSITQYSEETSGGAIPIGGFAIGSVSNTGTVTIDARVVDVNTGAIKFAVSEEGLATSSGGGLVSEYGGFASGKHGGTGYQAAERAVRKVVRMLERRLGGLSYEVVDVQSKDVLINAGSDKGVQKGDLFVIDEEGKPITDSRGTVLGVEKIYYGAIKVTNVQPGYSRCACVKGKDLIRKGDLIESIDSARELKGMDFATSRRNAKSDRLMDQLQGIEPAAENGVVQTHHVAAANPMETKSVAGVNPNTCTDEKLVSTYSLPAPVQRTLVTIYKNGIKKYRARQYKTAFDIFLRSAGEKSGDVLNTYWAGMSAAKLGRRNEARKWFEEVLSANPGYAPAQKALKNLK